METSVLDHKTIIDSYAGAGLNTPLRKRFQQTLTTHTPALVLDGEGTIQHINLNARRLLEYDPEQPVEPCFFSHIHNKNLYQVMRDVADMVCYGKAGASWLLRLNTGRHQWKWFKATVFNQLDHATPSIVITLDDMLDV